MTYTDSDVYSDYLAMCGGTIAYVDDILSSTWTWDISSLPTMYVSHPAIPVIAPFVENRFNRFSGHKFRLGGSKK